MDFSQDDLENGMMTEEPVQKVDLIEKITGAFGKYQLWMCLLIFLSEFPIAFHQMAIIFLVPRTPYTCHDGNTTIYEACPCLNPEYDTTVFASTMISEWDLICGDKWLIGFTQTLFQFGSLFGCIWFGMASDRFGRKIPLLIAVLLQIASGIGAAYAPTYWSFTIIRFITGISVGGTLVTGFVIVMEFTGTRHRDVLSALYQVPFNLGHMLLPLIGYFFRRFKEFQLVISIPTVVLLSYFFLVSEPPRWLIAVHKTEKAVKILERIAKVNNRDTGTIKWEVEAYQNANLTKSPRNGTLFDLVRTPNLRKNIIAMSFIWFACGYCFYGVSQYVGQLGGDIFINITISASVTLIGTLLSIPLMKFAGRRSIVIFLNLITALCLIILAVIPEGVGSLICASLGVVFSFIIFVVVYLYCIELFPTVVRSAAVGFSSMMARVGSMIAPFIVELGDVAPWLPPVAFALLPLLAGCVAFLIPETKGCQLMTTIEEGEQFGVRIKSKRKSNK